MNNIDKQALRLTAEKAKDNFIPNFMVPTRDVLELLDELEKMQAQSSKWCEAFHKAVSVGARYEERIAELESELNRHYESPDVYDMAIKQFESLAKS